MSITNGPNLGLMVNGNAGEAHYSQFMAFLRGVDGLVMPNVKGYLTNTPPASPSSGDCYIIGAAPTGAWAGQGGRVTRWSTTAAAWEFYTPKNGWVLEANSARESYRYTGGAWEIYYQEGTWTPGFGAGWTNTGTPIVAGKFRKIGAWVRCIADIGGSSAGGTGSVTFSGGAELTGHPFTPVTLPGYAGYATGNVNHTNGSAQVGTVFVSGTIAFLSGGAGPTTYSYSLSFDFFV